MNIFEYRPELKYIYDDINTINNIPQDILGSIDKSYLLNNPADLADRINSIIDRTNSILKELTNNLLHKSVAYSKLAIDPNLEGIVKSYPGGQLLIESGLISFSFATAIKNNPILYDIYREWEESNNGINGDLHTELYLKCEEIKKMLINSQEILDKTVNYMYNIGNGLGLKENQYKTLENYIRNKSDLKSSIVNKDVQKIVELQKNISEQEARLSHEVKLSKMLSSITDKLNRSLDLVSDSISPVYEDYISELNDRTQDVKNDISIGEEEIKPILYSSFKRLEDELKESKSLSLVALSDESQDRTKNSFIYNSRLYLDAGIPQISKIAYSNGRKNTATMDILINGLEKINKDYEQSLLSLTNFDSTKTNQLYGDIMTIYKKNDAREIYNRI